MRIVITGALTVDRRLVIQGVHPDDVADAVVRVLEQGVTGAFNLAAEPALGRHDIAKEELGWQPQTDARAALAEAVEGMAGHAGTPSPALRPRSVLDQLVRLVRRGPIGSRKLP